MDPIGVFRFAERPWRRERSACRMRTRSTITTATPGPDPHHERYYERQSSEDGGSHGAPACPPLPFKSNLSSIPAPSRRKGTLVA